MKIMREVDIFFVRENCMGQ